MWTRLAAFPVQRPPLQRPRQLHLLRPTIHPPWFLSLMNKLHAKKSWSKFWGVFFVDTTGPVGLWASRLMNNSKYPQLWCNLAESRNIMSTGGTSDKHRWWISAKWWELKIYFSSELGTKDVLSLKNKLSIQRQPEETLFVQGKGYRDTGSPVSPRNGQSPPGLWSSCHY